MTITRRHLALVLTRLSCQRADRIGRVNRKHRFT
jgi:hypothetical protein